MRRDRKYDKKEQQDGKVIQRQDSEGAPCVKMSKIVRRILGPQEDSGYQESRDYKKYVNAGPARLEHAKVVQQYQKNRQSPQTIDCADV